MDDFISDDPADIEHDIRFFDLMDSAGLIPNPPDTTARVARMMKKLKLRIMEWSGSQQRPYFVQELVNGLYEDE
jgi:hypothetical protein